jgi:hypothetical protein|mmetsp:Transcript_20694/g.33443  ORF Transcript_20694/g.33443 Transcript_20694/m.33443 type:complete len:358 (+) Transcript_20694:103-1176(+)
MVILEGSKFSYVEYQVMMLSLAGTICASLFIIEIAMRRFQVLPLLFPGMFSIRDRRFYFFNFDISDGTLGKTIRSEAKMLIRITICVVLSYLWEHCVLETVQLVGKSFPKDECDQGHDCFASTLHFVTFFNHNNEDVDCSNPKDFDQQMVVSCIRFVKPTASNWLMHLAIAHSITQLNLKSFELMVWVGGNSRWMRRFMGVFIFISLSVFVGLFFGGVLAGFVSSWLSFVMSLSVPAFLYVVYQTSKALSGLWRIDAEQVQKSIQEHLHGAFKDIESTIRHESEDGDKADVISEIANDKIPRKSKMKMISNLSGNLKGALAAMTGKAHGRASNDDEHGEGAHLRSDDDEGPEPKQTR